MHTGDPRFQRGPDFKTAKPRRVRGGLRLSKKDWPPRLGWAGMKWFEFVSRSATGEALSLGHEYARLGQTRAMEISPGVISGRVQGRVYEAYRVTITVPAFSEEQWGKLIGAMAEQAIFSAKLLSGEVGPGVEELLGTMGLSLLPEGEPGGGPGGGVTTSCPCGHEGSWCRHACCLALLAAEAVERDALTLFSLRGMRGADLVERLRDLRSARSAAAGAETSSGANGAAVGGAARRGIGGPDWPGLRDRDPAPALSECLDEFWEAGPELDEIETPMKPPTVSHALLRRLGPSPFEEAKFPLVGLLATCYDTISNRVIERERGSA